MGLSRFELDVAAVRGGKVVVDGVDISDRTAGLVLKARPGEVTRLIVELYGEGPVEGLGHVEFVNATAPLAEFFAAIDPEELEKAALDRLDGFGDRSATQAMLDVLSEWAQGR